MKIKRIYLVSYKDIDGNEYVANNIEAESEWKAEDIVIERVTKYLKQNFYHSYKAKFVNFC
jgi:hypothetical protein